MVISFVPRGEHKDQSSQEFSLYQDGTAEQRSTLESILQLYHPKINILKRQVFSLQFLLKLQVSLGFKYHLNHRTTTNGYLGFTKTLFQQSTQAWHQMIRNCRSGKHLHPEKKRWNLGTCLNTFWIERRLFTLKNALILGSQASQKNWTGPVLNTGIEITPPLSLSLSSWNASRAVSRPRLF